MSFHAPLSRPAFGLVKDMSLQAQQVTARGPQIDLKVADVTWPAQEMSRRLR